jgi:signal peptidase I
MIKALELTDWHVPNHTYLLSDDMSKCFGYIKASNGEKTMFLKPMRFDVRGRKFSKVYIQEEVKYDKKVIGSKGDVYYILDGRCTCTGFKFRGSCKHV